MIIPRSISYLENKADHTFRSDLQQQYQDLAKSHISYCSDDPSDLKSSKTLVLTGDLNDLRNV